MTNTPPNLLWLQRAIAHLKSCGDLPRIKSFTQLLGDIWKMLKSRLIDVAAYIHYCRSEIHSIFIRNESRPATYDIIYKLLNNLLLVNIIDLSRLRRCTEETLSQTNVQMIYYIRTFPMKKSTLESIVTNWEITNHRDAIAAHWQGPCDKIIHLHLRGS